MIKVKSLNKSFGPLKVFEDFNIDIQEGEVVCLLGPSGSGKSTLLKILSSLDKNYSGDLVGIKDKRISYVFQESRLIPWLSVKDNLTYVLDGKIAGEEIDGHVDHFLKEVGLSDFASAFPNTLSGGMKQRVSLARAFSCPHDILLLDEPFQGLDEELKDHLMSLLEDLIKKDKKTVIMVTHDLTEAFRLGDRVVRLIGQPIKTCEEIHENL